MSINVGLSVPCNCFIKVAPVFLQMVLFFVVFLYSEIGELMSELKKRFQMDKMLERTVAACVNDCDVPHLLNLHSFPPDVILGLAFYHFNKNIGHRYINDDILEVLVSYSAENVDCLEFVI